MTGPSSTPRGEHTPKPGTNWERQLVSLGEIVVDTDDGESPFGWREIDPPAANRETRRAARRAARRKNR